MPLPMIGKVQIISIRVTEQTRSELKKLRPFINWNQEIRDFIQKKG